MGVVDTFGPGLTYYLDILKVVTLWPKFTSEFFGTGHNVSSQKEDIIFSDRVSATV